MSPSVLVNKLAAGCIQRFPSFFECTASQATSGSSAALLDMLLLLHCLKSLQQCFALCVSDFSDYSSGCSDLPRSIHLLCRFTGSALLGRRAACAGEGWRRGAFSL